MIKTIRRGGTRRASPRLAMMKGSNSKAGGKRAKSNGHSPGSHGAASSQTDGIDFVACPKCGTHVEVSASTKGTTKMQFDRMLQIHEILRRDEHPSRDAIAAELGFSRNTIGADLEFMQTRLHLPLAYSATKRGWGYTQPMVEFPLLQITEQELIALCVAARALASFPGTPFAAVLRRILEKLGHAIRDRLKFSLAEVDSAISFGPAAIPAVDSHVYEQFSVAALTGEEIECVYGTLNGAPPRKRRLQPVHVTARNGLWYVLVQDRTRKQTIATYKLSRATEVKRTGRTFHKVPRAKWETVLANSIGIYGGVNPEQVRLRVTEVGRKLLVERPLHGTQRFTEQPDGTVELTLQAPVTPELENAILSWGTEIRVLEPDALRQRIGAIGRQLAEWAEER